MWRHNLTIAWRVLLADRLFTFVNLFGLAVGLASVILISVHVAAALSADRHLPDHRNLYRVDTLETVPGRAPLDIARAPGPLRAALLESFPDIRDVSRAYPVPASVVRDGMPFEQDILVADPNFFSLLGLKLRSGSAERALAGPASVAISERAAIRYFGTADAVGRRLTLLAPAPRDATVSAVFATLPDSSHLDIDVVIPTAAYFPSAGDAVAAIPEAWNGAYFFTYARLRSGADPAAIERHLPALVDRSLPASIATLLAGAPHDFYRFRFVPIADIAFDGGSIAGLKPQASRTNLWMLSGVALLILAIAAINFANLTTARSTLRSREVAIRKMVGAKRRQIFVQFMAEALLLTGLAGLLGLSLVELSYPYLSGPLGMAATLPDTGWRLVAALALGILATGIASGLYPSVILSGIRPASLFGDRETAVRTGLLREGLVIAQFAISIALIVATAVMLLQMRFTATADLRFDGSHMLVLRVPDLPEADGAARALKESLAREPGVSGLTLSSAVPSDESEDNLSIERPGEAKPLQLGFHRVDPDFFRTYRVPLLAGRAAAPPPDESGIRQVVINQAALRRLGFASPDQAIGSVLPTADVELRIVGVVPDLRFRSLHAPIRDELYILDETPGRMLSLRYDPATLATLLGAVERRWREQFPGRATDRAFLSDALAALYEEERRQARLIAAFAGIAILLSCLGLAAMSAFAARRRAREFAIRKVLGARGRDIVALLAWQFSKPVVLANLIAWPVAWWVMRDWLDQFDARIALTPGPFLLAGLLALAIALGTVAGHAIRVARTHPIHALRYE